MMHATRPALYRLRLAALCFALLLAPCASGAAVAGALPHPAARATWEIILADPYYPAEQLRAVAPTLLSDGYVAAGSGHGRSPIIEGAWVVRFEVNANILWQRTIGVGDTTDINAITTTSNGDYLLVGTLVMLASPPSRRGWLGKIDDNGNVVWQRTFAAGVDDQFYAAAEDVGGNFIVAGSTVAAGQSYADAWVLKVNSSGSPVWSKTYGDAAGDESARTIVATATSGPNPIPAYVVAGGRSVNAEQTAWVLKLGSSGAVLWQHTYGNSSDLAFADGIVDTGDGFALTGLRNSVFSANRSTWLFKIDGNGNLLWDHTLSSALQEDGLSLYQTHDGGLVTLGRVNLTAAPLNLRLSKWDAAGGLLWTRMYGRGGADMVGHGVLETGDYGLVIAGSTQPVAAAKGSGTAALFMKVDAQGAAGAGCLAQQSPVGTVFTLTSAISTTTALISGAAVTATVDAATTVSGTATTRAFACAYLPLVAR